MTAFQKGWPDPGPLYVPGMPPAVAGMVERGHVEVGRVFHQAPAAAPAIAPARVAAAAPPSERAELEVLKRARERVAKSAGAKLMLGQAVKEVLKADGALADRYYAERLARMPVVGAVLGKRRAHRDEEE